MHNKDPKDFLKDFHRHAQEHGHAVNNKSVVDHNAKVKEKIVSILGQIKGSRNELEKLQQTNPKAYASMMQMVQAMMSMAKDYMVPKYPSQEAKPKEPAQPEAPAQPSQELMQKKESLNLPAGSELVGAQKDAKSRPKVKVTRPKGAESKTTTIQARTGETTDPRWSTGGTQPLSHKTYVTVSNRGQSKRDPQEEAENPK